MDNIQLIYGNFRYLIFVKDDQYYLLDRIPSRFIGYFLPPVNWVLYQKVYPITLSQYAKIKDKNDRAPKLAFLIPIAIGLSVYVANKFRLENNDMMKYFQTDFSVVANVITLLIGSILVGILVRVFYFYRKKSMGALIGSTLDHPHYYKIRPLKLKIKQLFSYFVVLGGLTLFASGYYIYSGNLLFALFSLMMQFFYLIGSNVSFGTESQQLYKIVDRRMGK